MADLFHMPLFVDDYEAATPHLSLEEDGAYNRLLRLCWRQNDCTVPDDPAWLARMLRCDNETFVRVIRPIVDEFFTRSNGKLFQKRQKREHGYVKDVVSKRKAAGRKGGNAKSLKNKDNTDSKATVLPEQNDSKALAPTPTLKPTLTPSTAVARDAFEEMDAALRRIEGVESHPIFADPVIAPIWQMAQQGYDFKTQIKPSIKRQLQNVNGKRISRWSYFVPGIIEDAKSSTASGPSATPEKWAERVEWGRKNQQWGPTWGPMPGQSGCAVPASMLKPEDGQGWTEWKASA